jgi:DNA-binding transcriptional MerR regulator
MLDDALEQLKYMKGIPLTIHQVSLITQVSKSTLRYWEKTFAEYLNPERNRGGRRHYDVDDVKRIILVKHMLKDEGYTITGARKKLGLAA